MVRESWSEVTIPAPAYYERCRPLIEKTIAATENLIQSYDEAARVDALYVTGGGSELPMVARHSEGSFRAKGKAVCVHTIGNCNRACDPGGRRSRLRAAARTSHATSVCGANRKPAGRSRSTRCFRKGLRCRGQGEAPFTIARTLRTRSTISAISATSSAATCTDDGRARRRHHGMGRDPVSVRSVRC